MASISNDDNNNGNTITIQLTVTSAQGAPRVPVTIDTSISAQELRATAATVTHIPLESLKLIFRGRLIGGASGDDSSNVAAVTEFKLEDGSVVHCMGKPVSTTAAAANSGTTSAAVGTTQLLPTVSVPSSSATTTTTTVASHLPAVTTADPLTLALQNLRTSNPPDVYQTAITTLSKILQNITTHPLEAKYRSLKVDNAAFQRRLGGVAGGDAAIRACGFQVEEQEENGTTCRKYVLQANPQAWPAVQHAAHTVHAAAALASATTAFNSNGVSSFLLNSNNNNNSMGAMGTGMWPNLMPPGAMTGAGGAGLGAGGLPPGMLDSPEMQQMAAQMMSNPQALQAMVQDPMMQNMIRNDPRFANNPQVQQLVQEMGNNPQVAQMMSQLIANPQARAQLLALEQQYGGAPPPDPARMAQLLQGMMATNSGGGVSGAGSSTNPPLPSSGTRSSGANNSTSGNTDEDLTEEEMIAEAIRRSLQDGSNGGGGF